jgi:hypothetical protein
MYGNECITRLLQTKSDALSSKTQDNKSPK